MAAGLPSFLPRVQRAMRWYHDNFARLFSLHDKIEQRLAPLMHETLVQTTPILALVLHVKPQRLTQPGALPIYNPSVLADDGGLLFAVRESNATRLADGAMHYLSTPHRTDTLLIAHHPGQAPHITRLDDTALRTTPGLADAGIEDLRLFRWRGELYGLCAGVCHGPDGSWQVRQILLRLEAGHIAAYWPLPSPIGASIEKNWVPLVDGNKLLLVYTLQPAIAYEFADGAMHLASPQPPTHNLPALRGGTPFIPYEDGFLAFAHTAPIHARGKLFYRHVAVLADAQARPRQISEPFFLSRKGIEFACGLTRRDDSFILSYGVGDSTADYLTLPERAIPEIFAGL